MGLLDEKATLIAGQDPGDASAEGIAKLLTDSNLFTKAVEEGIIAGGGTVLRGYYNEEDGNFENEDQRLGRDIVVKACKAPFDAILENAGLNAEVIWNKIVTTGDGTTSGYDVRTDDVLEDMVDVGIIDPVKVTRVALEKAASVAGTMLTTECVVTVIPKDQATPQQPPMM